METDRDMRAVLRNILICYFFSGALGLIYEILWLRKLLLVFGSTVHAVSTILTVFFGGLALGSWLLGRLIDRREGAGLRWYAALEAGIGVYALATPWLFEVIQRVYIPIYQSSGFSTTVLVTASFVCSAAILLIPTALLGATFPVLSRFLIRSSEERGVKIATLYGINTAGAMAGTLFVYHVGLPTLGLFRTLLCAVVLNLGIGALCLAFDRHLEALGFRGRGGAAPPESSAAAESDEELRQFSWLMAAFGLSGFSAMVYEVAWTRTLSLVLGSSIYAFCIMLATFLGGMAIGSLRTRRRLARQPARLADFVTIEVFLGAYGLLSIPLLTQLPDWFVALWPLAGGSFAWLSCLHVAISASAMILPTYLMGCLFPLVSDLVTRRFAQLGQRLGTAYAVNTLGGIVGSFLSGFVLIPWWGLPWAIVVAAGVNIAAGFIASFSSRSRISVPRMALAAASVAGVLVLSQAVVLPMWRRQVFAAGVYLSPNAYRGGRVAEQSAEAELLYYRDGLNATVSVHRKGETIFLKVGGKTDASNGVDMGTQALSAHIPMLLHGHPERVLVIGLGSGVTLGHAGRYPVRLLYCAEIEEAVIEGARWFKDYNYAIHEDPRVTFFAADGRNFLLAAPQSYDVIISEPSNPWMAGLAYLFTREFYQLAKQRLAPGGVMCQWLQLYQIFPQDVKLVLKTFHEEFPHVSVWSSIHGDLLLVGSLQPHDVEFGQLAERMAQPAVREALRVVDVDRPEVLLQMFLFGNAELDQLTADTPWLHEDDLPWLEFSAPKALYAGPTLALNFMGLERMKSQPAQIARGYDPTRETADFYRAMGKLWNRRWQLDKAKAALEQAVTRDTTSVETWVELGKLYIQFQEHLRAEDALATAIRLAPSNQEAVRLLARLRWQQRQLEEAGQLYEQAARLKPPDGLFAEELGNYLRETKQLLLAAECYRSAVSQGGGSRRALLSAYAAVLKELRSWQDMQAVLQFGIRAFPKEAAFPLLLGEALLDQGRPLDAEPLFRQALTVAPGSTQAYYGLGRVALGNGHAEGAERYLKLGLRYDPYHREALELLHRLHQEQRGPASAAGT